MFYNVFIVIFFTLLLFHIHTTFCLEKGVFVKSYGTGGVAGTGQRSVALKSLLGYICGEGGRGIVCSVEGHK